MKALKSFFLHVIFFSLAFHSSTIKAQSGWMLQPSIGQYGFSKVLFINPQTGFITGYSNKIFRTTNTGASWTEYAISDSANDLRDIFFVNQTTGFIAGGMLSLHPPSDLYVTSLILKTTDAGVSWIKVFYDTNQSVQKHFSTVSFADENTGYVGGGLYGFGPNYLYKSTNGGNDWKEISYDYPSFPQAMDFQNNSEGVAVMFSQILKTNNGGSTWSTIQTSNFLFDLFFINGTTAYACGGEPFFNNKGTSLVMKTTNAGNNWQNILNANGDRYSSLNSVFFTDINTGYSVGSYFPGKTDTSSLILKTIDQGVNWGFQNSPPGRSLLSVEFINNNTGFAVGLHGTILKTTDGGGQIISGIGSYSSEIPEGFTLHQNYPNPFNPSTTIRYAIPNRQQVSLKIYNVLGNEIESLITEVQNAGMYEVKWNAVNQPSGIYYYKIQADNYSNTMKMLLVK